MNAELQTTSTPLAKQGADRYPSPQVTEPPNPRVTRCSCQAGSGRHTPHVLMEQMEHWVGIRGAGMLPQAWPAPPMKHRMGALVALPPRRRSTARNSTTLRKVSVRVRVRVGVRGRPRKEAQG